MVRCQTVMNAATATRGTQRGAGSEGQAADERWRILSLMLCTHFLAQVLYLRGGSKHRRRLSE